MRNRFCAPRGRSVGLLAGAMVLLLIPGAIGAEEPALNPQSPQAGTAAAHEHAPHAKEHTHDPGHGNAGASLEDPGEFRGDLAIYTFVVFLLLLALLGKFAWPAISKALEEREKRIEGNIADAEAKHEQAKQLLAEHEAKLARTADEVRELMEEARRDAEHTKKQIVAEAKLASDQERDRALRDVERAADIALKSLAESSANLAVDLASKVVQQNISADQQAQLVRDALSTLAATSPSKN